MMLEVVVVQLGLPSYGGDGGGFKSDLDLGDVQTDDDGNILIYSNASGNRLFMMLFRQEANLQHRNEHLS